MTEKRFTFDIDNENGTDEPYFNNGTDSFYVNDADEMELFIKEMNELAEENQTLKAMLKNNVDEGICNICKYFYLEVHKDMPQYYIGKCEKGHEKASKEDVKYCDDFDLKKELQE